MKRLLRETIALLVACVGSVASAQIYYATPDFAPVFEQATGRPYGLAKGPDGSLLVFGTFTSAGGARGDDLAILRADGTPGPHLRIPAFFGSILCAQLQADGKILIGGTFAEIGTKKRTGLARLHADGTLDESFAPDLGTPARVNSIALMASGRFVVCGSFQVPAVPGLNNIARINPDATIDGTFLPPTSPNWAAKVVAFDPDGRILVSGGIVIGGSGEAVSRLNTDGSRDTTFVSPFMPGDQPDIVRPLADGSVLVAGGLTRRNGIAFESLYRLLHDGSIDPAFAATGKYSGPVSALDVLPDGRILAAGPYRSAADQPLRGLSVLTPTGELDPTFADGAVQEIINGIAAFPDGRIFAAAFGSLREVDLTGAIVPGSIRPLNEAAPVTSVVRLADGRWLAAGDFTSVSGTPRAGVVRLTASGAVDPTFIPPADLKLSSTKVAPLPDGKVVLVGEASYNTPYGPYAFRLLPDGSRDTTFDSTGVRLRYFKTIAVQTDGRIVVGGSFMSSVGSPRDYLLRLTTSGSVDGSFSSPAVTQDVKKVVALPDDRLLIVGSQGSGLMRLSPNGALDTAFSIGAGFDNWANDIARLPDGRLLLAGAFTTVQGTTRGALARLSADGALDTGFAPAIPRPPYSGNAELLRIAVMDDATLWAQWGSSKFLRISPDGTSVTEATIDGSMGTIRDFGSGGPTNLPVLAGNWETLTDAVPGGMALLALAPHPVIAQGPASVAAEPGQALTLSVTASGGDLTYQWLKDGVAIAGARGSTLTLSDVTWRDSGAYTVTVSNRFYTVTSSAATVSGPRAAPTITAQPQSIAARVGAAAALSVAATSSAPHAIQWRRNRVELPGATGATLPFTAIGYSDAGFYDAVISDGLSPTVTESVEVRVYPGSFAAGYGARADLVPRLERDGGSIHALLAGPDGTCLVAGDFSSVGTAPTAFLARFLADGSPDPQFAPATIDGGAVTAIAIQPDGRILAGGSFTRVAGQDVGHLVRLMPDGSLDTTFSADVGMDAPDYYGPIVAALAVQADGRILVGGGFTHVDGNPQRHITRLGASGAIDPTFTPPLAINWSARALLALPDGRILAGGDFNSPLYPGYAYLVRLFDDGRLDTGFKPAPALTSGVIALARLPDASTLAATRLAPGLARLLENGQAMPGFAGPFLASSEITCMSVIDDARVLVGGLLYHRNDRESTHLVELTTQGVPVADRFTATPAWSSDILAIAPGPAGTVRAVLSTFPVGSTSARHHWLRLSSEATATVLDSEPALSPASVFAICPLPNERWAVGGTFNHVNGSPRGGFTVMRRDGTVDTTFAPGTGTDNTVTALALDGANRLLVGGNFAKLDGEEAAGLARLLPDGRRDPAFAPPARFDTSYFSEQIHVLPDGDILLNQGFSLMRLAPDGTRRPAFPAAGSPTLGVYAMLPRRDGRMLVAGPFYRVGNTEHRHLARLMPDGSLDSAFTPTLGAAGTCLMPDPLGRIVAGTSGGMERIRADETLDYEFAGRSRGGQLLITDIEGGILHTLGASFGRVLPDGQADPAFTLWNMVPYKQDGLVVNVVAPGPGDGILIGGSGLAADGATNTGLLLLERALPPQITEAPASRQASPGETVTFTVKVTETDATYQWYHDGRAIPGASAASLVLRGVAARHAGTYVVKVTGRYGTTTSAPAVLSGLGAPPVIGTHPASTILVTGNTLTLSVAATGEAPLAYQWRHNRVPLAGATAATLTIPGVAQADAGSYDCVVSAGLSAATSQMAMVTVQPPVVGGTLAPEPSAGALVEHDGAIIRALAMLADGSFYAGGSLSRVGSIRATGIARFGSDGVPLAEFVPPEIIAGDVHAIAVQADGKVVVGGDFVIAGGTRPQHIARFLPDGSLDAGFAVGVGFDLPVRALAVENSGRIIAGGEFTRFGLLEARHVAVLTAGGALDATFAAHASLDGAVHAIALRPGGGFVLSGEFTKFGTADRHNFVWLSAQGVADLGKVQPSFGYADMMGFQPDGRLVVAGARMNIQRLNTDGSIDVAFSPSGEITGGTGVSFAFTPGGRILVGCQTADRGGRIVQLLADGTFDASFSPVLLTRGDPGRLAVRADGSIVCGETLDFHGRPGRLGLRHYTAAGAEIHRDAPRIYRPGRVNTIAPADNGWWIAGGDFDRVNGTYSPGLARLTETGTVDARFAVGTGFDGEVSCVLPLADGSVLAGGSFTRVDGAPAPALVRVAWNGARDPHFSFDARSDAQVHALAFRGDATPVAIISRARAIEGRDFELVAIGLDGASSPMLVHPSAFIGGRNSLHLLPGGDLLVGGDRVGLDWDQGTGPARLGPGGSRIATHLNDPAIQGVVSAFAPAPAGGFYMAGDFYHAEVEPLYYPRIHRRDVTGKMDPKFKPIAGFDAPVSGLIAQTDGTILAWGRFSSFDGMPMPGIGMLTSAAKVSPTFRIEDLAGPDGITSVRVTDTGRMLLAGGGFAAGDRVIDGICLVGSGVPTIVRQPSFEESPVAGRPLLLTAEAAGDGVAYQWQHYQPPAISSLSIAGAGDAGQLTLRYVDVPGATGATFTIPLLQGLHAGYYRVIVTRAGRSVASDPVYVSPTTPDSANSRVANLSTRARCLDGDNILIPGFVIEGPGQRQLLIRAVGQRLLDFGVSDVLPDPSLVVKRLRNGAYEDIASNDNWGDNANAAEIKATASRIGAFRLIDGSVDAALLLELPAGQYTAFGRDSQARSGVAIVEIYDADANAGSANLVNLSNRGYVGTGGDVMIPGFVVSSEGPRTFLIRAVGPTLASFGVSSVLPNPRLDLYRKVPDAPSDEWLLGNDDWEQSPDAARTASTARQVHAFGLQSGSQDAACVVTLPPGSYTVHASGVGGTTGVALVEVYLVP